MKLSVTIITFNEEANIERAIRSVNFADEIIVVDSGSKDNTRELAMKLGARIYEYPFEGFGQQKNLAASFCQGKWILNIDADEEVSSKLRQEIERITNSTSDSMEQEIHLYSMPRLTFFCGRPMHHGGWYPDLKARLYLRGEVMWTTPHVHEDLRPLRNNSKGILHGDLYHYSFPTVKSQVLTNINYATLGAKELIKRKERKPFFFELLLRPTLKFGECYLWKRGFLDGIRGLIIAINASYSMFMKYSFAYMDMEKNHD